VVEYLHNEAQSSLPSAKPNSSNARLLVAAAIGVLALMALYLTPGDLLRESFPTPTSGMPILLKALFYFEEWLHTPVVQIAGLVFIVFMAVRRRDRPEAWIYAFLSGFALTLMVAGRLLL
jgi:hypothetical protein